MKVSIVPSPSVFRVVEANAKSSRIEPVTTHALRGFRPTDAPTFDQRPLMT